MKTMKQKRVSRMGIYGEIMMGNKVMIYLIDGYSEII